MDMATTQVVHCWGCGRTIRGHPADSRSRVSTLWSPISRGSDDEVVFSRSRHAKVYRFPKRGPVGVRASTGGQKPGGREESKMVYDAFFLGKALAETINERVGSAVGEFLSDVGRRQAEQQKRIREFQDEVQQRAAAAAVMAAQKALATERVKEESKPESTASQPSQPPASTSGLSNPEDAPTSISIE